MSHAPWWGETLRVASWTLLHLCWQGAAVGIVAFLTSRAFRQAAPSVRYVLALAAFAVLVFVPIGTAARLALHAVPEARRDREANHAVVAPRAIGSAQRVELNNGDKGLGNGLHTTLASDDPHVATTIARHWGERLRRFGPVAVLFWLAGVLAFGVRLLLDLRQSQRLRLAAACVPSDTIQTAVRRIASEMGISRRVPVIISSRIDGPAVIGVLSPALVLPLRLASGLTPVQLDLLLAHELAHIARRDYLVNVLQAIAEVALFFHPTVWWISRALRQEREHCCDAVAARRPGGGYELARALLVLEEHRGRTTQRLVMAARSGDLLSRVQRLVAPPAPSPALGIRVAAVGAIIAVGVAATTAATAPRSLPPRAVSAGALTVTGAPPIAQPIAARGLDSAHAAPNQTTTVRRPVSDSVQRAPGNADTGYSDSLVVRQRALDLVNVISESFTVGRRRVLLAAPPTYPGPFTGLVLIDGARPTAQQIQTLHRTDVRWFQFRDSAYAVEHYPQPDAVNGVIAFETRR